MSEYISPLMPIGCKNKVLLRETKNLIYLKFCDSEKGSIDYMYINFLKISETSAYRCADNYRGKQRFLCLKYGRELTLGYLNEVDSIYTPPNHEIILIKEQKEDVMGKVQMVFFPTPLAFPVFATPLHKIDLQVTKANVTCAAPNLIKYDPVIQPPYDRFCASGKRKRRAIGVIKGHPKVLTIFSIL